METSGASVAVRNAEPLPRFASTRLLRAGSSIPFSGMTNCRGDLQSRTDG